MAEQCIVCLEDLQVVASRSSPQQQQQRQHPDGTTPTTAQDLVAVPPPPTPSNNQPEEYEHNNNSIEKEPSPCPLSNEDKIAVIEVCGHILHDVCLRAWTGKANSCPICRQTFHVVNVYDTVGGNLLSTYKVEDKKQVAEFDQQAWLDDNPEEEEEEVAPCPVCGLADREDVLLLCDGCDTPYHTHCIGLDSVPRGSWFCMECADALGAELDRARPEAIVQRLAGRGDYFPRTQASMRRARRRARSDEWMGAWGQISGRIYSALNLDVDAHDEDNAFEEYRRTQQLRDMERREFQRWQQRLNIADRLGARDVFARNIQNVVGQQLPSRASPQATSVPAPPQETREERRAWGAFDMARDLNENIIARRPKRKSRSITASPVEPPQPEERRLKRPRTRRLPLHSEAGPSTPVVSTSISRPNQNGGASGQLPRLNGEAPSFLSSLLKEVETNIPSDDEAIRNLFADSRAIDASSPGASPIASTHNSPRAMSATPPPHPHGRSVSPALSLSSSIEPIYPPANYSPTSSSRNRPDLASRRPPDSNGASSGDEVDHNRHQSAYGSPEIRQPRPRRRHNVPTRSVEASPNRQTLPLAVKEHISTIVRKVLSPHWKTGHLTADQYASINRTVSHKLYEEVTDPGSFNDETKEIWERLAAKEVTHAMGEMKV